jgi:hypothetical protein
MRLEPWFIFLCCGGMVHEPHSYIGWDYTTNMVDIGIHNLFDGGFFDNKKGRSGEDPA